MKNKVERLINKNIKLENSFDNLAKKVNLPTKNDSSFVIPLSVIGGIASLGKGLVISTAVVTTIVFASYAFLSSGKGSGGGGGGSSHHHIDDSKRFHIIKYYYDYESFNDEYVFIRDNVTDYIEPKLTAFIIDCSDFEDISSSHEKNIDCRYQIVGIDDCYNYLNNSCIVNSHHHYIIQPEYSRYEKNTFYIDDVKCSWEYFIEFLPGYYYNEESKKYYSYQINDKNMSLEFNGQLDKYICDKWKGILNQKDINESRYHFVLNNSDVPLAVFGTNYSVSMPDGISNEESIEIDKKASEYAFEKSQIVKNNVVDKYSELVDNILVGNAV